MTSLEQRDTEERGHGHDGSLTLMEALEWSVVQAKARRRRDEEADHVR